MTQALSKPTRRTSARRAQRRRSILDAAEQLPAGFTTEDLASAAGIGQASLFYYFKGGRAEIEAALALRRQWALQDEWRAAVAAAPGGVSALCAVLEAMQLQFERDADWVTTILEAQLRGPWPAELLQEQAAVVNQLYDLLEERLLADRAAGRLHPDISDLRRYVRMTIGAGIGEMMHAGFIARAGGAPRHSLREAMGELIALVRRGSSA